MIDPGTISGGLLGAALVLGPAVLGWAAGRGLGNRGRTGALLALAIADVALVPLMAPAALFDFVLACLALGAGLLASNAPPRELLRWLAAFAMFALLAESLGRLALPEPPVRGNGRGWAAYGGVAPVLTAGHCAHLFPDSPWGTDEVRDLWETPPERPVVLHLGDSMLALPHATAEGDVRAHASLQRRDPGREHLLLAWPAMGPDTHLALARTWAERLDVDTFVVAIYPGNDLADLDRPYVCCDDGPLLGDGPELASTCPDATRPAWATSSLVPDLVRVPVPLAVQAASAWSTVAAHVRLRLDAVVGHGLAWSLEPMQADEVLPPDELDARMARLGHVLAGLRDVAAAERADLQIVLLPYAPELERLRAEGDSPAYARSRRQLALAEGLGLDVVDTWPAFQTAQPTWFMADGQHFEAPAHEQLARALAPALGMADVHAAAGRRPADPPRDD